MQITTVKIFTNGGSQAVRLPAEFRFEAGAEVYIRREPETGDVVLSLRPNASWKDFVALRAELADAELAGFMRDRQQPPAQQRDPFADADGKTA